MAGRPVTGRINAADDSGVTLEVDGEASRPVGWAELGRGKVQVEFNRANDAGGASDAMEED